jgi:predicted nucleic acid-binding protein
MNSTIDKVFVDTNVLIYAHDKDAGAKHEIARKIIQELWEEQTGVLSVQVLQEFYVNVTRKIPSPLPKNSARAIVRVWMPWCANTTPDEINGAFQIEDQAQISFWDALIVSSALKRGARRILSEDLQAGQHVAGILIVNPFLPAP